MRSTPAGLLGIGVLALALLVSACGPRPSTAGHRPPEGPGHPLRGTVVEVLEDRGTVLVDHEEIPGVMPRMTMEFAVARDVLPTLRAGQRIRARMVETADGVSLEGVWPEETLADPRLAALSEELRQDTQVRGKSAYRDVGETVPRFALVDQDGKVVTSSELTARPLVLSFIFTRCTVAAMCPATTAKMGRLQRAAAEKGLSDSVQFALITLDPEFDTPPVLKAYARNYALDLGNFRLLSGPLDVVGDLLRQFGVLVGPDDNVLRHTSSTLLIGADGRIAYREDGSGWKPEPFLERLQRMVPTKAAATSSH